MTSPPAAPVAGGQRQRPQAKGSKSGPRDSKTTGRHELSRHARFAEISPAVGVLDEQALHQALADDPTAFELLAAMTTATDENLRAAAIRLCAALVLERARAGRATTRGISRLRPVRGAADGDLDIDASVEGVSAARAEARPVELDDLTTVQWARAPTAFAVVVDRSGSMNGARLAAAATVAAACALRAPAEHAILSFAGSVEVIRPLVSDIVPATVAERLLRLRGHGVTRLADALQAAHEQLARARAPRRVVILLSDCRSTEDDDTVETARALPELIILAPADDHDQAAALASQAGARWAPIAHPLDAAAVLDRLLETRAARLSRLRPSQLGRESIEQELEAELEAPVAIGDHRIGHRGDDRESVRGQPAEIVPDLAEVLVHVQTLRDLGGVQGSLVHVRVDVDLQPVDGPGRHLVGEPGRSQDGQQALDHTQPVRAGGDGGERGPGDVGVPGPDFLGVPGVGPQMFLPVGRIRLGDLDLGGDLVDHELEQLVAAGHVRVQRRRTGAQILGDPPGADRVQAVPVEDPDRRGDDSFPGQRLPGRTAAPWLLPGQRRHFSLALGERFGFHGSSIADCCS